MFDNHRCLKAPIRCQTQSYDAISCYGNSVKRTNEIAYVPVLPYD